MDDTIYLIQCRDPSGLRFFAERDAADCDLETTIRNLLVGAFTRPLAVFRMNTADRTSADESADVAAEVLRRAAHEGRTLTSGVRDFVERWCGTDAIHELDRAAA